MSILPQARHFLNLHEGRCSVKANSRFASAFRLMEQAGEVTIKPSGTPDFIDIYIASYVPKFNGKKD